MPPGRGGAEHGWTVEGHQPATGREEDAPPQSPPPLPVTKVSLQMKMKMKKQEQQPHPMGSLPEGPLVKILSRVPYKSVCRFKCASKPWLDLCGDPELRKRCPQTMSGFFHNTTRAGLGFRSVSGRNPPMFDPPSPPFLTGPYRRAEVEQCCGGLLLCKYWTSYRGRSREMYGYAVCNPATGQWNVLPSPTTVLPDTADGGDPEIFDVMDELFLAFDATNSPSRFVVFAPLSDAIGEIPQIAIFSSETQRWTSVENGWGRKTMLVSTLECVLFNGIMHFLTYHDTIVTVDMEGKDWGKIEMSDHTPGNASIGQSQGCLHAWEVDTGCKLSVWVLEDYASGKKWTLKHTANVSQLFGRQLDGDDRSDSYWIPAIHPDCNVIFITHKDKRTVSYDMDTRKVDVICTSGDLQDGAPYVPCFVELSLDGR